MPKQVLLLPVCISAQGAWQSARALGAKSLLEPWGRQSTKLGEDAVELVEADEVLLPLTYAYAAILIQRNGAGVFNLAVAASCGLLIRNRIDMPVSVGDVSKLGIVHGQMCFNPSDSGDVVLLGEYALP